MSEHSANMDIGSMINNVLENLPKEGLDSGSFLAALSLMTTMQLLDLLDRFLNNSPLLATKSDATRDVPGAPGLSVQSLLGLLQSQPGSAQGKLNPSALLGLLSLLEKDKSDGTTIKDTISLPRSIGSEKPRSLNEPDRR